MSNKGHQEDCCRDVARCNWKQWQTNDVDVITCFGEERKWSSQCGLMTVMVVELNEKCLMAKENKFVKTWHIQLTIVW